MLNLHKLIIIEAEFEKTPCIFLIGHPIIESDIPEQYKAYKVKRKNDTIITTCLPLPSVNCYVLFEKSSNNFTRYNTKRTKECQWKETENGMTEKLQEHINNMFEDTCYEYYKLQWMLSHKYTLTKLICQLDVEQSLTQLYDENPEAANLKSIFKEWEQNSGFQCEMWSDKNHFLRNEYQNVDYMSSLLYDKTEWFYYTHNHRHYNQQDNQ